MSNPRYPTRPDARSARDVLVAAAWLIAAFVALVASPHVVRASCMPPDPRGQLAEADAAFIGTLDEVGVPLPMPLDDGNGFIPLAPFRFSVERWLKGDLGGPSVEIFSTTGTSADFSFAVGTRIGVLVHIEDGRPTSGGCLTFDPDVLIAAAAPIPEPDGSGPAALIVGGDFGSGRLVSLDANGRVLAYGPGDGATGSISMCPGRRLLVETSWSPMAEAGADIVVRDAASLEVLRELDSNNLFAGADGSAGAVSCLDADADRIAASVPGVGVVTIGSESSVVTDGTVQWVMFVEGGALFRAEMKGQSGGLQFLDLENGAMHTIHEFATSPDAIGDIQATVVSPDGTRVAIVDWLDGRPTHDLTIRSLADGAIAVRTTFPSHLGITTALWADDETLAVFSYGSGEEGAPTDGLVRLVRARDGAEIGRWRGWTIDPRLIADGVILGIDDGHLVAAPVAGGNPRAVFTFDGLLIGPVVAQPGFDGASLVAASRELKHESEPAGDARAEPGVQAVGGPAVLIVALGLVAVASIVVAAAMLRARSRRT